MRMNNKIKELREKKGWSQEHLGEMVGVSRQTVIAIEKGKYNPLLELAFKLRNVFDLSIEDMFNPEE